MTSGSSQFNIGGNPLRCKKINKEGLREFYRATQAAEPAEGKEAALDAITALGKDGEMSTEQYESLDAYSKSVYKEYRADKDSMWETWKSNGRNWKDPKIKAIKGEMGVSGEFLTHSNTLATAYRESTALAATQAIAGTGGGAVSVIAGYAAYANSKQWDSSAQANTERLVQTYQELESGKSRMNSSGNSVHQIHRAELWKAMNDGLDHAVESGEKGNPLPITMQYYEFTSPAMIGKIAAAGKAGSKVRANFDPGRLSYPSKDEKTGEKYFDVDDIPHKMRTILQLANVEGADIGVSIYPIKEQLDDPTDLMHRKVLRIGEEVFLTGMNANMGSGENIDAGYTYKGPVTKTITENLIRDIDNSNGATKEDIWGEKHLELFGTADMRMGMRGITAMLDAMSGPSPAGEGLPGEGTGKPHTEKSLNALAKKAGVKLDEMFEVPDGNFSERLDNVIHGREKFSLSEKGRDAFMSVIDKAIAATNTKKNKAALSDITLPEGKKAGTTEVAVADLPHEREALTIKAIMDAEKFVYLPGFVVTRAVAGAIVAKRDQMEAAGKEFDIKVMADSGIYPDGGTPNSWGVNFLEDNNIPVRWSKLTRTGHHDRKIHAKQLLTDKGEIAGSTNFSKKGMRENWETSAYVQFDPKDKEALESREASKAQFESLWEDESYSLSVLDTARYMARYDRGQGEEWAAEQSRNRATKEIIGKIEDYEEATGDMVENAVENNPDVKSLFEGFMAEGYSAGDSALKALEGHYGKEKFLKMRHDLPAHKELVELQNRVESWKKKYG